MHARLSTDIYARLPALERGKLNVGPRTNNIGTYCTRVLEYRMVLVLYGARTCARTIQRSVHRCAITSLRSTSDHSREINRGHIRCLFSTEARKKEEKKERKKRAKLIHYGTVPETSVQVWCLERPQIPGMRTVRVPGELMLLLT